MSGTPPFSSDKVLSRREVEAALDRFDSIGRAQFLKEYGGGGSVKAYIQTRSKEYDAKAILVVASRMLPGMAGATAADFPTDFRSVVAPLRELGYIVIEREAVKVSGSNTITSTIERVLTLQSSYDRNAQAPAMVERRGALEALVNELVTACGPTFGLDESMSWDLSGDVSLGAGYVPKVAWARLMNEEMSPSAQAGWYVVLLFAADGSSCCMSLNQGATSVEGPNKQEIIRRRATEARNYLQRTLSESDGDLWTRFGGLPTHYLVGDPDLRGGNLGGLYEVGHIEGVVYKKGEVPADEVIIHDARALLAMLGKLYEKGEDMPAEIESTGTHDHEDPRLVDAAKRLNIGVSEVRELLDGVQGNKRQMILMGPPGTGKTFVAQELAKLLVEDESDVRLIQFHPSYGYEDFVEGLRPMPLEHGGFEFRRVPGVLVEMASLIAADGKTRVLIIDEINRANIPKVFGELMFLLEYRDETIRLMLDGRDFSLPDNLILIGTMNTADRSIRTLDVAMRRRFRFFELLPRTDIVRKQFQKPGWTNELGETLLLGIESLNGKLLEDIDRHHTIGHSYFLQRKMNRSVLEGIWNQEVFPLIEDYFFDRPDKAGEYTSESFWPNA